MSKKRETVGKLATDLMGKQTELHSPIDIQREVQKSYPESLIQCAQEGKKKFPDNFYIVVTLKQERLFKNVLRTYFCPRLTCPSPEYDQTVYYYNKAQDRIEFVWVVPDKYTCGYLAHHKNQVVPEERELLKFVLMLYSGELLNIAQQRNGEKKGSLILES